MTLFLGCPAWGLKTWVGRLFPEDTRQRDFLAVYSRRLNAVEGNTTFYALPSVETVERWREEAPPGFRFCLKVPQAISHRKRLRDARGETEAFVDRLRRLGDRRGPALLQLPPSFSAKELPAIEAFLAAWPRDLACAVEPRHADFFAGGPEAAFDDALRRFGVARCAFDTTALFSLPADHSLAVRDAQSKKPRFPRRHTRTAAFAFVRYVSHPDIQANRPWLEPWAERVAQWLVQGDDVYFFTHHPNDTHAPEAARFFHELVSAKCSVAPLPDWGAGSAPAQPGLF